jgi:hypothetical protein
MRVKEVCKELLEDAAAAPDKKTEEELLCNAQGLYSRCLADFKMMPKNIRDELTDQQILEKDQI